MVWLNVEHLAKGTENDDAAQVKCEFYKGRVTFVKSILYELI